MPFFSFKDVLFSAAFLAVVLLAVRVASFVVVFVVEVAVFIAAVLLVARAALVPVYVLTAETVCSLKLLPELLPVLAMQLR